MGRASKDKFVIWIWNLGLELYEFQIPIPRADGPVDRHASVDSSAATPFTFADPRGHPRRGAATSSSNSAASCRSKSAPELEFDAFKCELPATLCTRRPRRASGRRHSAWSSSRWRIANRFDNRPLPGCGACSRGGASRHSSRRCSMGATAHPCRRYPSATVMATKMPFISRG